MKKHPSQNRSELTRAAIAREVSASAARVSRDVDQGEPVAARHELVTDFLEAITIDDSAADRLWSDIPPADLDDAELVAFASDVSQRVAEQAAGQPTRPSANVGSARVTEKLRGPRHPFE
jgi:hypothetical protein